MSLERTIDVLIVDDHQLIIEGLRSILEDEPGISLCGGVNSGKEAIAFLETHKVDVVLVDVNMPEQSGIKLTSEIKSLFPEVNILTLTMHEDISTITKMVEAGADGYIFKRTNMYEVPEAIRMVARNERYLGKDVQRVMMDSLGARETVNVMSDSDPVSLTSREKEILTLVVKEFSNREIAETLFISERTVETHRRNILTKTKTKSIVGLIKYAIRENIVNP